MRGKVAVVTGAGSGIGRALAAELGRRGARVHTVDVNPGCDHVVDVADAAAVQALAEAVGPVDLLFNNAGIGHAGPVEATSLEDWRRVVEVNLMGVVHGVHAFLPGMLERGRGHIVNTASMAGLVANPMLTPYSTTKFAVVGLTEALDMEVRHRGVRVHAVCPGVIDTDIVRTTRMSGGFGDHRARIERLYRRRGASPERVAQDVLRGVERGRQVIVTPRAHVLPAWYLKRFAPPVQQALGRALFRVSGIRR